MKLIAQNPREEVQSLDFQG